MTTRMTATYGQRVMAVVISAALALLVAGFASLAWGGLLVANLQLSPAIPWAVAVMAGVLVLMGLYLGGRWAPASTAARRRELLRFRRVSAAAMRWGLLAGGLSLAALVGLWIVLVELTGAGGNPTIPTAKDIPIWTLALMLVMGSFVSSLTEEWAFRGYAQVTLERVFGGVGAVVISSLYFMLYHGPTQGFAWSKLLFYFVVGAVFGSIAFMAGTTLLAWPAHLAGDLTFFFLIWPYDATRPDIFRSGADGAFWLALVGLVVFAALALLAFRQLYRVTRGAAASSIASAGLAAS
jgi:membrane protease YdiL (CAAX protease family)